MNKTQFERELDNTYIKFNNLKKIIKEANKKLKRQNKNEILYPGKYLRRYHTEEFEKIYKLHKGEK